MMADGFLGFNASAAPSSALPDVIERAFDSILLEADSPERLNQYLEEIRASQAKTGTVSSPNENARIWSAVLKGAEKLALTLRSKHPRDDAEREFGVVKSAVSTRANVLQVFRLLTQGGCRRKQIVAGTGLADEKIQRVLRWGVANGLVVFEPAGDESYYRLSQLGELVLESLDEPTWLHLAGSFVRAAFKFRIKGTRASSLPSSVTERLSRKTGLTIHAAERTLEAMFQALDPISVSSFGSSLAVVSRERKGVLLFAPLPEEQPKRNPTISHNPTVLLMRALERFGVFSLGVEEPVPSDFRTSRHGWPSLTLPMDRPIVSCSLMSKVTTTLCIAFGDVLRFQEGVLVVRGEAPEGEQVQYQIEAGGLVVRIYDSERGVSHLIVGGLDCRGRLAASRFCYEHLEDMVAERPEQSFAAYMAPDVDSVRVITLRTTSPEIDEAQMVFVRDSSSAPIRPSVTPSLVIVMKDQRREDRRESDSLASDEWIPVGVGAL